MRHRVQQQNQFQQELLTSWPWDVYVVLPVDIPIQDPESAVSDSAEHIVAQYSRHCSHGQDFPQSLQRPSVVNHSLHKRGRAWSHVPAKLIVQQCCGNRVAPCRSTSR